LGQALEGFPVEELPEPGLGASTDWSRASVKPGIPSPACDMEFFSIPYPVLPTSTTANPQTAWALLAGNKERQGGSSSFWACLDALELPAAAALAAVPAAKQASLLHYPRLTAVPFHQSLLVPQAKKLHSNAVKPLNGHWKLPATGD